MGWNCKGEGKSKMRGAFPFDFAQGRDDGVKQTTAKMRSRSFDCGTHGEAVSPFAQDDTSFIVRRTNEGLVGSGGGFAGFYFFEEPDDSYTEEAEEGEPAEDVDEGPVGGLAAELAVESGLGGREGVGGAEVGGEEVLEIAEGVLELLAGLRDGVEDLVLVDGGATGEES